MNLYCEKLDLSLTDTQLPMFLRLIELCLAVYYGTLKLPEASERISDSDHFMKPEEESGYTNIPV